MKSKGFILLTVCALLLSSCKGQPTVSELPTPQVEVSSAPDVESVVGAYLSQWESGEFAQMYQMLTASSQKNITTEDFTAAYQDTAFNMTLQSVETQLLSSMKNPNSATARFKTVFHTSLFGNFERDVEAVLSLEGGSWKMNWDPGLILPELAGGNRLQLESIYSERGEIYARDGQPIVEQTTAYALAIIPNQIEDGKEGI